MPRTDGQDRQTSLGVAGGVKAFEAGVRFVLTTPSVWPYALVPVAIMTALAVVLVALGFWGSWQVSASLFGQAPGTWGRVGAWAVTVLLGLVSLLAAVLVALALAQPLSGFALEAIVHAHERALTGRTTPPPSFLRALVGSVKVVSFSLLLGGPTLAALAVVNFLVPPALVVTVPAKFLVCAWLLAWDFLDYPLGLRGYGIRGRLGWVGRHFGAFTAFGAVWTLLVFMPGVVLVLLPPAVAGATWLVVEADDEHRRV